jgi:hypothetical protein
MTRRVSICDVDGGCCKYRASETGEREHCGDLKAAEFQQSDIVGTARSPRAHRRRSTYRPPDAAVLAKTRPTSRRSDGVSCETAWSVMASNLTYDI